MKKSLFILIAMMIPIYFYSQTDIYERDWGTYLFSGKAQILNMIDDVEGNLYLVGFISNDRSENPLEGFVTQGAFQENYGGGVYDGFLLKLDGECNTLWGTYIGGEGDDFISDLKFNSLGNLILLGGSSSENMATQDSYQVNKSQGWDMYLAEFTSYGIRNWATYYGGLGEEGFLLSQLDNGFHTDHTSNVFPGLEINPITNDIYFYNKIFLNENEEITNLATPGVFEEDILNDTTYIVSKFSANGDRIWTTNYCYPDSDITQIIWKNNGLYVIGNSYDYPWYETYPNSYFNTLDVEVDASDFFKIYFSKFDDSGQRLWSKYIDAYGIQKIGRKAILASEDSFYMTGYCSDSGVMSTPGVYNEYAYPNTHFIMKFDWNGNVVWCTYLGEDGPTPSNYTTSSISIDEDGNIYITGTTDNTKSVASTNGYKTEKDNSMDVFVMKFTNNGNFLYGTYYGGWQDEYYFQMTIPYSTEFYTNGLSRSDDQIASENGRQNEYPTDIIYPIPYMVKFSATQLSTNAELENGNLSYIIHYNSKTKI